MPARGAALLRRFDELREEFASYVSDCDEANRLLDLADEEGIEIRWNPSAGESLRDALRKAERERGR